MGSIIECVKRTYIIQTSNGVKMEVESEERSLNGHTTAKLLKEDIEISSFFEKCKILNVDIVPKGDIIESAHKKAEKKSKNRRKKKRTYTKRKEKQARIEIEKAEPEIGDNSHEERLTPLKRLNTLLKTKGEFTRPEYQKYMENSGHKISNFMGHEDIEAALLLRRIEPTGEKIGRGLKKYRVVDADPVDEDAYRQALKEYKTRAKQ